MWQTMTSILLFHLGNSSALLVNSCLHLEIYPRPGLSPTITLHHPSQCSFASTYSQDKSIRNIPTLTSSFPQVNQVFFIDIQGEAIYRTKQIHFNLMRDLQEYYPLNYLAHHILISPKLYQFRMQFGIVILTFKTRCSSDIFVLHKYDKIH